MKENQYTYMDYAATTPVDDRVLQAMLPYFKNSFGNTSSIHHYGQIAESALEDSREIIAAGLNCSPKEVVFTSCGSESDNLAIKGAAFAARRKTNANHILIGSAEHPAVTQTAIQLARLHQFDVEMLPVDRYGMVDPEVVRNKIRSDTALVSIIYANNEIGTINPIAEIGKICSEKGVLCHTDAVQAAAYLPVDTEELRVDLLSLGAHKFYGPKGIGALYIRDQTVLDPLLTGGSQEFGLRAGTHNTPYIVGMAKALQLAITERKQRTENVKPLRDALMGQVLDSIPDSQLSGHPIQRLPNHASFVFKNVDGNTLLMQLDVNGFACSSGSACKSGDPEPSKTLLNIGFPSDWALGSLRVTFGAHSSISHVKGFGQVLPGLVTQNRNIRG